MLIIYGGITREVGDVPAVLIRGAWLDLWKLEAE